MTILAYQAFSPETIFQSLSQICTKILERNEKALILTENENTAKEIDEKLWTSNISFIPHAILTDPTFAKFSTKIPIKITITNQTVEPNELHEVKNIIFFETQNIGAEQYYTQNVNTIFLSTSFREDFLTNTQNIQINIQSENGKWSVRN